MHDVSFVGVDSLEIERALRNMGTDKLQNVFLSRACMDVLKALDPASVNPENLLNLVIDKVSRTEMLRDRKMRHALLMSLGRNSMTRLAKILGIEGQDEYAAVTRQSFRRNSEKEKALFRFFGAEWSEYTIPAKPPSSDAATAARPLFDHQIVAIEKIERILQEPEARVLLHMPTGAGKTRTAMRVVADLFLKDRAALVIWMAYSEELCEQAIEEFKAAWHHAGNKTVPVYRFFGSHSPDLLSSNCKTGLIVAGLGKMYKTAQKKDLFLTTLADRVSLVIIDEAHQAVAETYKFILSYLVEKHGVGLLGLSATPGRTWSDVGADKALAEFFNKTKVTLDVGMHPVKFLIKDGFIAKARVKQISHNGHLSEADRMRIEKALEIPEDVLVKLARDEIRNVKIVDQVEELIKSKHRRIIVFAASIAHARDLSLILHTRGHRAFYVDAGTPRDVRDQIIDQYKEDGGEPRIICNYGVLTTGFDAPRTTAVVIARPTKSLVLYSQMVGRAIRGPRVGGSKYCAVVTVTDITLPGFGSVVDAFSNWEDVWE